MARLSRLENDQLPEESQKILSEIQRTFGVVPNLFRTYAQYPPLLRANWDKVKVALMQGEFSRGFKEAIAVLVSHDNGCRYCVCAHTAMLRQVGVSEETISAIVEDRLSDAGFDDREQALIRLMRKANLQPHEVSDADFESAREAGASERDILEAYSVMETFLAFNRFLDSVDVEIDLK
jgi:uncharacterized peroxidase-related enzyme